MSGTNTKSQDDSNRSTTVAESAVRPSISLRLIRHAESNNNKVYRDARYKFRGGTPEFDCDGWTKYVDENRSCDPALSPTGRIQAEKLADYMVPHLNHQSSRPVHIITSPMRRTLETIRPTIQRLEQLHPNSCKILVNGFYYESDGCHTKEKAEPGMTPSEIGTVLREHYDDKVKDLDCSKLAISYEGFPDMEKGWYCGAKGPGTRADSEVRATKMYLWLCDHLDRQLAEHSEHEDLFDAGVAIPGEEDEDEQDKMAPRQRRRRMAFLIGHGDFMSLLLKRIIAGFGHFNETKGVPHRSAFTHFNTGITELEYFGHGRFLVMGHNMTPHVPPEERSALLSGGSLKDGWSYIVPEDEHVQLYGEVAVAFSDEDLESHVVEQREALKSLYLNTLSGVEDSEEKISDVSHFIVKRGLQVVGVASYVESTGELMDVAVLPSAGKEAGTNLFKSVQAHAKKQGRTESLVLVPRSTESKNLLIQMGFGSENATDGRLIFVG